MVARGVYSHTKHFEDRVSSDADNSVNPLCHRQNLHLKFNTDRIHSPKFCEGKTVYFNKVI